MNAFTPPPVISKQFDRRGFLRIGGLSALAVGGAAVLAACSTGSTSTGSSTAAATGMASAAPWSWGSIVLPLSWIKNIECAGEYFATEKGYYTDAGFEAVTLLAGGGQTGAEEALRSGQALVGLSPPRNTGPPAGHG